MTLRLFLDILLVAITIAQGVALWLLARECRALTRYVDHHCPQ